MDLETIGQIARAVLDYRRREIDSLRETEPLAPASEQSIFDTKQSFVQMFGVSPDDAYFTLSRLVSGAIVQDARIFSAARTSASWIVRENAALRENAVIGSSFLEKTVYGWSESGYYLFNHCTSRFECLPLDDVTYVIWHANQFSEMLRHLFRNVL